MHCKSNALESFTIQLEDNDFDIHHTCRSCGIHFNHLDGRHTKDAKNVLTINDEFTVNNFLNKLV